MSIVVCDPALGETPSTHACVDQTTLQPVSVRLVGDGVFGPIDPTSFVIVALATYGLVLMPRLFDTLVSIFKVRGLT